MRTDPAPGSDPTPAEVAPEERASDVTGEAPLAEDAHDEALRRDRPPHWG